MEKMKDAGLEKMAGLEETLQATSEAIQKAAVINSTYTFSPDSRSIFVAENLETTVKLIVPTATPLRSEFPRKPGRGQASAWKKLTSAIDPGTGGTGTTGFFTDGGTPSETTQTYSVSSAAYKLIGRKVSVGLLAVAASQGYMDQEAELIRIKTLEVMLAEESAIINGDTAGADSNSFDGLAKGITTYSGSASLLTASGISVYGRSIFNSGGNPTHLVLHARQNNALADELQQTGAIQRINISDSKNVVAYQRVTHIVDSNSGNEVKLVVSRYTGAWAFLLSMKSEAGENYLEMEDLIPLIKLDIPETTFAKTAFVVESTVLKIIAEPYQYKIGALATS